MTDKITQSNLERENYFHSKKYLDNLKSKLSIFISSHLPESTKDKIAVQIRQSVLSNGIYESQIAALKCIKDIEVSHVLTCNKIGVEACLTEWYALEKALKEVKRKFATLKAFNDCKELIKEIQNSFQEERLSHYRNLDRTQLWARIIREHKMGSFKLFQKN